MERLESRYLLAAATVVTDVDANENLAFPSRSIPELTLPMADLRLGGSFAEPDDGLGLDLDFPTDEPFGRGFDFIEQPESQPILQPSLEDPSLSETPAFGELPPFAGPPIDLPPDLPGATQPPEPLPNLPLGRPRIALPPVIEDSPTDLPTTIPPTHDIPARLADDVPAVARRFQPSAPDRYPISISAVNTKPAKPLPSSAVHEPSAKSRHAETRLTESRYFSWNTQDESFTWKLNSSSPATIKRSHAPVAERLGDSAKHHNNTNQQQDGDERTLASVNRTSNQTFVTRAFDSPGTTPASVQVSRSAAPAIVTVADQTDPALIRIDHDEDKQATQHQAKTGLAILLTTLWIRSWHNRRQRTT
ncbi:MAG: hypothetical protein AB8B91_19550 [Rubripirellula sp.]